MENNNITAMEIYTPIIFVKRVIKRLFRSPHTYVMPLLCNVSFTNEEDAKKYKQNYIDYLIQNQVLTKEELLEGGKLKDDFKYIIKKSSLYLRSPF